MKVKIPSLTPIQVEKYLTHLAPKVGEFKLDNVRHEGNYCLFVLRMASNTPSTSERRWMEKSDTVLLGGEGCTKYHKLAQSMKYRRLSAGRILSGRGREYGTAVCWHGFRDFLSAVFSEHPDAVARTARAAYVGRDGFEANHPATGRANVGSRFCPVSYDECCDC